jgi:hypothetical protein
VTLSQILAAAEACRRGDERARKAGIPQAASTGALVIGRLQDYLASLNTERQTGLAADDLAHAVLAVAKKASRLFVERGYTQRLMPAAFRAYWQVTGLAGAPVTMTIHPSIQNALNDADAAGCLVYREGIGDLVDEDAVARVRRALSEYHLAEDPEALTPDRFATYGATAMTLHGFDVTGWQKLLTL